MTDDILTESYSFYGEEEAGLVVVFLVSFVSLLKEITSHNEFKPLDGENGIFITGGEKGRRLRQFA